MGREDRHRHTVLTQHHHRGVHHGCLLVVALASVYVCVYVYVCEDVCEKIKEAEDDK